MFDSDYLRAIDLQGKSHVLTIEKVLPGTLNQTGGKKKRMPVLYFKGRKKPMGCNATNCKTLKQLYGKMTEDWVGKEIEVYPTITQFGSDKDVDCIRMRAPRGAQRSLEPEPEQEENKTEYRCEDGRCGECGWCRAVARDMQESTE